MLGFLFGIAQMLLYVVYKKKKNVVVEPAVPEHVVKIMELTIAPTSELSLVIEEDDEKKKMMMKKKVVEEDKGMKKGEMEEKLEIIPII